ncbi:Gfo/Idh/MocA family protein [Ammoniphilus resinae]|uniref:Dehydrogenase n=1 Tax=Ammoniphilus resinae TaxID=861532 RepID=A0ABS4GKU3_9BACL|nr:Gfo/Idh/MocA family oxidoreductase [Ammoniphilus resinae]MBP1930861.1 putative dehydrogenase [Ammoniphilus resinae]
MRKNWKVGLVGTGFWSSNHLQAWSRIPSVEITALCDRIPEKLVDKAKQFGIVEDRLFTSLEEMLEKTDIDIVDIVTGPETHLRLITIAAKAGKHIMCQKPFAPSLSEASAIVRVVREHGVRLMVTENWRWLQPYQALKNVLDKGVMGKVRAVRFHHKSLYTPRMSPDVELPQPFFRTMPQLLFYEMGPHWFDTWRFLFGTPKRLYAELGRISPYIVGEDTGVVMLSHEDFYGHMDMSWATGEEVEGLLAEEIRNEWVEQMVIDGDRGTVTLHGTGKFKEGRITFTDLTGVEQVLVPSTLADTPESHFRLQSHFIHCLNTGEPFQTDGEQNLVTLKMVFATYQSAEEHRPVEIY